MAKLTRTPKSEVQDFIEGAEREQSTPKAEAPKQEIKESFPWDDPKVREDVIKALNLRLPEPYLLKLRFIAERTPYSQQKFIHSVLFPAIDAKIRELTESDS